MIESLKASIKDKRILWLFLIAAFIVVVILLSLLFSHDSGSKSIKADTAEFTSDPITIVPNTIDFTNTPIGKTKSEEVKITVNTPIEITKIDGTETIDGLELDQTCTTLGEIKKGISCTIKISYNPTEYTGKKTVPVNITWHNSNYSMDKKNQIIVSISTESKKDVIKEPEEIIISDEDIEESNPIDRRRAIIGDIEDIAPPIKAPITPKQDNIPEIPVPSESCSDFAFPGYDFSGTQIGWIKPEFGAYKFYPFTDRNCENPTGIYNPDTGIITDIDDKSQKIGTDAEHIGLKHTQSTNQIPQLQSIPDKKQKIKLNTPTPVKLGGLKKQAVEEDVYMGTGEGTVVSSKPYDRTFLLRQFKPIPATIVSEIRADVAALETGLPVRATVDRNVYSDNGRTVILPAGTLLMGYVSGTLPGPYTTIGRMDIKWYQFIRPDGVEFNFFGENTPFSADAQGRSGVPGHGSSDYLEQFVMPMLTAVVPTAVNMIAPVTDAFVNQIDLDNNTVVQSGTVRSSELAKNEIINTWNKIAQKLMVDMMDNTTPPFSIAAGTRITVFSPKDLLVTCGSSSDAGNEGKKCAIAAYGSDKRYYQKSDATPNYDDSSWIGQVRSFDLASFCDNGKLAAGVTAASIQQAGHDYRTVLAYCQSTQYQAKNNAKQEAIYKNQQDPSNQKSIASLGGKESQDYHTQVLGLKYNEDGSIENPFIKQKEEKNTVADEVITCEDGNVPDSNGCCGGETYTNMDDGRQCCCSDAGGDCFPPIGNEASCPTPDEN